jgi:predicted ATP-dependent serine protease
VGLLSLILGLNYYKVKDYTMSSLRDKVIPKDWIAFGEVGLTGEVRPVYNASEY